jgi:hypothetical protein
MQVELRTVKKGQIVEFTVEFPYKVCRAKVTKTRKNAVAVELEDIDGTSLRVIPGNVLVTIVND